MDLGQQPAGLTQIATIFARVINLAVGISFVALVIVLVYAGFRYLTSGGEAKAVASATQAVTWGLLGILFLAIAWLIIQLIAAFTGIEALKSFDIGILTR